MNLKGGNNMNNKIWDYISTILIIINGVICTIYHQEIYVWLPSICAIVLLIKGTITVSYTHLWRNMQIFQRESYFH